ncbi:hypothetical protein ACFVSN_06810 [Kitasatospora sp. NPDC057904]|uniref:helix-turn-helix transcriptional regulator n=1 Tax=unclassified Kitasatospora TaxID=2633591 RepID=UPI0036DB35A3
MVQVERSGASPYPAPAREPARAPADSLARRKADQDLVDRLAAGGWTGPDYVLFEAAMIATGTKVLRHWIVTEQIHHRCFVAGRPLDTDAGTRRVLRERVDERESLIGETVALAWTRFREKALIEGGWSCAGGATLASYFVGAVLLAFPGAHRRWCREFGAGAAVEVPLGDALPDIVDGGEVQQDRAHDDIVPDLAASETVIADLGPDLTPDQCRILAEIFRWRALGLTDKEIGARLGLSEGAVSMRVKRLRDHLGRGRQRGPRQPGEQQDPTNEERRRTHP